MTSDVMGGKIHWRGTIAITESKISETEGIQGKCITARRFWQVCHCAQHAVSGRLKIARSSSGYVLQLYTVTLRALEVTGGAFFLHVYGWSLPVTGPCLVDKTVHSGAQSS